MLIQEAIDLLQVEYDADKKNGQHYLKAIQALKRKIEIIDIYPYNLALAIFENSWDHKDDCRYESINKAKKLSIQGIEETLLTITDRERNVLKQIYEEGLTLKQVGINIGVGSDRIRQIRNKALRKLGHSSRITKMMAHSRETLERYVSERNDARIEIAVLKTALKIHNEEQITPAERNCLISVSNKLNTPSKELCSIIEASNLVDVETEELGLSVRAYNCVKRAGINKLGDFFDKTISDISNLRNMGTKSLVEIINKLKEYGIELKEK